ncbi:hypothetical protein HHK36_031029 [Tetracentron sinense]|uniref:Uncharacterized protein n=1 Tax=Tetracentron sinense TaxID=13715 RepID=A0A834Y8V8_TETSI|nr:hypothetical protein HHK36_031029 [Tetracentron sinense]
MSYGGSSSSSSSGEEDGDANWRAAIDSVANTDAISAANGFTAMSNDSEKHVGHSNPKFEEDLEKKQKSQVLKLYQIKAQKLLDNILEKSLVMVKDPIHVLDDNNEGGIRLFKHAPPGIVFDHSDQLQQPRKRPRILPGGEIDEKSNKFRLQLHSVAVDGKDIMAAAGDAHQKSLARFEAKDAAAKASAKREEERVAELRRIRGEKWLPSIAREMQLMIGAAAEDGLSVVAASVLDKLVVYVTGKRK